MSQINVNNLTFSYSNDFDYIFKDVSLTIDTDWKLGFIGRNGRGKTTFLKLLSGNLEYSGIITKTVEVDYFPYTIDDKSKNAIDVVEKIYPNFELWKLNREFNLLKIDSEVLYRPFNSLSAGEQVKTILAVLFLKENNFLLIDEPTNHLDLIGRKIVSEYLNTKKGFILVSHDRQFLDNCIDHILTINKTDIKVEKGNFSSWEINKSRQDNFEINKNEKLKSEISHLKDAAKQKSDWSFATEKSKYGKSDSPKKDRGYIGHKAAKVMKSSKVIEEHKEKAIMEKSQLLKNIEEMQMLKIYPQNYHSKKIIDVKNLSISYENVIVFDNLSFSVDRGDRVAIRGKNGSGK